MTSVRRLLGAGAAIALASGSLLMTPSMASADEGIPAEPAPTATAAEGEVPVGEPSAVEAPSEVTPFVYTGNEAFTLSPAGPYSGGQQISVNLTGWTKGQLVVILTCPKGVFPKANPPGAGCAPYTNPAGGGTVGTIGDGGKGSFKLTIVEGKLDGTSYTCSTKTPCTIGAYGTDSDGVPAKTPKAQTITYKSAATSGSSTSGSSTSTSSTSTSSGSTSGSSTSGSSTSSGTTTSSGTGGLVNTGPGDAPELAMTGFGVLVLGSLMMAFTRRRSTSTTTA